MSFLDGRVTESVGPVALKPVKRQGWWKGKVCFILEAGNLGVGGGQMSVQRLTPPTAPPDNQGARAFIDRGRRLQAETAQSALTVILKLVMQWSDQYHLDCFRYS